MPSDHEGPAADGLRALQQDTRWAASIESLHELPASPGTYGEWPGALAPEVLEALVRLGAERPYRHQEAAAHAALSGANVAIATGTASGKSLCYIVPVAHALVREPSARALFIFPTKALAHDQLSALAQWEEALGAPMLQPASYDGDTPRSARPRIRADARVILTNPDMLHLGILPYHPKWSALFQGLTHVVVDEMHVYRGVFGSHVANVLRRLRRVSRFYGSNPRFLMTSATIANPGELGRELAGAEVSVVEEDASPKGRRVFAFYNPPIIDARMNLRRSPILEAEALARHFLVRGAQTIVFARTRQTAELIVRYAAESLTTETSASNTEPIVRGYRGGYTSSERRAIESALRAGKLRGVVATNALELGIDIGSLEACIMTGYPGTVASTWQQAGRAGRRGDVAVAILVGSSSPLDQFIMRHPEYVLSRSPEHARLDPDNLLILLDHVRCAAFELPLDEEEQKAPFGGSREWSESAAPIVGEIVTVLEGEGVVQQVGGRAYWMADAYPSSEVGLRTAGPDAVTILRCEPKALGENQPAQASRADDAGEGGALGPTDDREDRYDVLGTVEREAATYMVHPGAIYMHDGAAYEVQELDLDSSRAVVVAAAGATYTRASSQVDVQPSRIADERNSCGATVYHGELEVRSRVTGYRTIRLRTHETLSWAALDLPEHQHIAGAYWFTLDGETVERLEALGRWEIVATGDRGADWRQARDLARARDAFRCQLCGAPERPGRQHDVHHLRPFREFGWRKGENEAYRAANQLENLITLCPSCHTIAERALGLHGALSGVGHAMMHIAPLYLMCDSRDLGVTTTSHAPWSRKPTVVIYERAAAGVGFGRVLFEHHETLVAACAALIAECPCDSGCPSCVGAPGEQDHHAKAHAATVLATLSRPSGSRGPGAPG